MLILDKSRALDLMVAQSERVAVPEPFAAAPAEVAEPRRPFRVAVYGPLQRSEEPRPVWRGLAPAPSF